MARPRIQNKQGEIKQRYSVYTYPSIYEKIKELIDESNSRKQEEPKKDTVLRNKESTTNSKDVSFLKRHGWL